MTIAASGTPQQPHETGSRDDPHLDELTALTEAGLAIVRSQFDVDGLCELVYQQVARIVDAQSFHLGLFEGDSFDLKIWVQNGEREPPASFPGGQDAGIVGWLRSTQQPLLVHDFSVEMDRLPARPSYEAEHPPRSAVFVPLVAGDQVVGSMAVQNARPHAFDEVDVQLLAIIANQTASALANARLVRDLQRRVDQLSAIAEVGNAITAELYLDELLVKVVKLIRERFGYYHVQVFVVEEATHRLIFRASTGHRLNQIWRDQQRSQRFGEGIIGWVAATGERLVANDVAREPRYIADDPRLLPGTRSEVAVPLRFEGQVVGVLDVQSRELNGFGEEDLYVLGMLANQVAVAVDSAWTYRAQQEEAEISRSLLEVSTAIANARSQDAMLAQVVALTPRLAGFDRCTALLSDGEQGSLVVAGRFPEPDGADPLAGRQRLDPADLPLLNLAVSTRRVQRVDDVGQSDLVPAAWREAAGSKTLAVAPLFSQDTVYGALLVDSVRQSHAMSKRREDILAGIARQASLALENFQLQAQEKERTRMAQELQVAQRIQASFLAQKTPHLPGYDLAHTWQSAREVGGDFYDFIPLDNGRLGLLIGDVADKSVPAALFMATSLTFLRVSAGSHEAPGEALLRANRLIGAGNSTGMFTTAWYGVLDPEMHTLTYANAGHGLALHVGGDDGAIRPLRPRGIPLGLQEHPGIVPDHAYMGPGDLLVLYTDGVSDITDEAEQEFGQERLERVLAAHRAEPAQAILDAVLSAIWAHAAGAPLFDDLTLMIVKRQP